MNSCFSGRQYSQYKIQVCLGKTPDYLLTDTICGKYNCCVQLVSLERFSWGQNAHNNHCGGYVIKLNDQHFPSNCIRWNSITLGC